MRFFAFVEGGDVRLELRVGCRRIPATIAHVRAFTSVCALMVIFSLVCREGLGAGWVTAGIWAVPGVT
jgi:hypothetical protein